MKPQIMWAVPWMDGGNKPMDVEKHGVYALYGWIAEDEKEGAK